jgi:protein-S-isoprenylcysteine O-methyltransferase Ste14
MTAWINFAILLSATILLLYFYVLSARPAAREKIIGPRAYRQWFQYRLIAMAFELIIAVNYILYFFPRWRLRCPMIGILNAGEEALRPKKEHAMYGGIYERIRHPQAGGESFLFAVMGFLLNSPFLTLFSLVHFPILAMMCYAEEQDLLLRYGDACAEYCRRTGAFCPKRRRNNA